MFTREPITYGLQDVCRRFGETADSGRARTERWQVAYLTGLVERYRFPAPLPRMIGNRWIDLPHASSRWSQSSVDAWFDDRRPPDAAARDERARQRAGEEDMRLAAAGLAERMRAANIRVAA